MHSQKKLMATLILLGGPAVLLSYAWGATSWSSESVGRLWGDVPLAIQPYYTSWMFVAATGFLLFAHFLFFATDAVIGAGQIVLNDVPEGAVLRRVS